MKQVILSFLTGASCGVVFGFLKLPIPAPPTLAGVVGIVGVFAGFILVRFLWH